MDKNEIVKIIREILDEPITLKYKKLVPEAKDPFKKHPNDACWDVFATSYNQEENYLEYGTGLAFEIPPGYEILVFPRSSISVTSLVLANSVAVVDEGYKGEFMCRFKTVAPYTGKRYVIGDRIAQIRLIKRENVNLIETSDLTNSTRGAGGFGSTGKA